jgi:RimJ/RimL family protein N-acetyltransferase
MRRARIESYSPRERRIRTDQRPMGLATEAARACRDYGFKQVGLRRLISIIESENAGYPP